MEKEPSDLIGNPNALTLTLLVKQAIENHIKEDDSRSERIEIALKDGKDGRARLHDKLEAGVSELRNLSLSMAAEMRGDARETRHDLSGKLQLLTTAYEVMGEKIETTEERVAALELAMDGQKGISKYREGGIAVICLAIGVFGLYAAQQYFS